MKIRESKTLRNKQGILIYLNNRLERIQEVAWENNKEIPPKIEEHFQDCDTNYYKEYINLISRYSKELSTSNLDLTKDFKPPTSVNISVLALEEVNLHFQENGIKSTSYKLDNKKLEKGNIYLLKRSDAEPYIRRGMLSISEI